MVQLATLLQACSLQGCQVEERQQFEQFVWTLCIGVLILLLNVLYIHWPSLVRRVRMERQETPLVAVPIEDSSGQQTQ